MRRASEPWYGSGLRFTCEPDCGACCTNHGKYSYVYLEGDDLARLAAHLELTPEEFAERYTEMEEGHRVLRMDGSTCRFLDGTRCTVYPARPTQCDTFPFWPDNLLTRERWRQLRRFCPGIGRGALHSPETIKLTLGRHEEDR